MMAKKIFLAVCIFTAISISPMKAQFKNLGKVFEKAVDSAVDKVGKAAKDMATDAALEMGANKASDQIIKFMDNNNKISPSNSVYATRLKDILGSNFNTVEGKQLNIQVYETPEANIITLNNGNIRVYSGMMDILSDDELKALVALQAGHIKTGNIRDNLLRAVSGNEIDGMSESQVDKILSFSGDKIKVIMNELLQLPYTKEQNQSADKYAKQYLKNNGGSNDGYSSFLSKLRKLAQVDLNSDSLDKEDEIIIQATAASSFINVNSFR